MLAGDGNLKCCPHPFLQLYMVSCQVIDSVKQLFSSIKVKHCFFHFKMSIYRQARKKYKLKENPLFKFGMSILSNLALVPVGHVAHIYQSLILPFWRNTSFNDSSCIRFNDYFDRTYVGTEVKRPLYLQNEWNVCNLANECTDITNNLQERHFREYNRIMSNSKSFENTIINFRQLSAYERLKIEHKRKVYTFVSKCSPTFGSCDPLNYFLNIFEIQSFKK